MITLLSDARFDSLINLAVASIAIIPATAAAFWARSAKQNSIEARNNSEEARDNSAGALHEVKANGGMADPDPTLKDYIKFVGELVESDSRRLDKVEALLDEHIKHSRIMDAALAEVFFKVKPDLNTKHFMDL